MIQLDRISKSYAGETVLNEVSLSIDPGDRVGLVGPNGTGKTSLINIIAGLEPADSGSIVTRRDLRIGVLPQEIVPGNQNSVLRELLRDYPNYWRYKALLEAGDDELDGAELFILQEEIEHELGFDIESRANEILSGLGFDEVHRNRRVDQLSGGFRMRVELARLLLTPHDVVLLDEPTNHLDMQSLTWLEQYLTSFKGAMVIIAHDRYFLNYFATRIAHLERGKLHIVKGTYDDFLERKREEDDTLRHEHDKQQKEIKHIQSYIDKYIGQPKRSRMVSSRKKMLERIKRVELPAPPPKRIRIAMPEVERSGTDVVVLRHVSKSYPSIQLYDDASLTIYRGEKVALLGPNGSGKTTLLKIMAKEEEPDSGEVAHGHRVRPFYYTQHQLEQLDTGRSIFDEALASGGKNPDTTVRNVLGAFGFSGDYVHNLIATLSGGEKARLALTKMILRLPNLLFLDEPTNHLDIPSREVLIDALEQYEGTIVFISHDRYFVDQIATKVIEVYRGELMHYVGNYTDYHPRSRFLTGPEASPFKAEKRRAQGSGKSRKGDRTRKRREAELRNQRYRATREQRERLAEVELIIEKLEEHQRGLYAELAEPDVYEQYDRYRELLDKSGAVATKLETLYTEWAELSSLIEEAMESES